MDFHEKRVRQF